MGAIDTENVKTATNVTGSVNFQGAQPGSTQLSEVTLTIHYSPFIIHYDSHLADSKGTFFNTPGRTPLLFGVQYKDTE